MFLYSEKHGLMTMEDKIHNDGVCVYISDTWCRDAVTLFTSGRVYDYYQPFYLFVAVYKNEALRKLYYAICKQQTYPNGFLILAGDFNHAESRLPTFN